MPGPGVNYFPQCLQCRANVKKVFVIKVQKNTKPCVVSDDKIMIKLFRFYEPNPEFEAPETVFGLIDSRIPNAHISGY